MRDRYDDDDPFGADDDDDGEMAAAAQLGGGGGSASSSSIGVPSKPAELSVSDNSVDVVWTMPAELPAGGGEGAKIPTPSPLYTHTTQHPPPCLTRSCVFVQRDHLPRQAQNGQTHKHTSRNAQNVKLNNKISTKLIQSRSLTLCDLHRGKL
eukprot:COSAG06_NODE_502_length_14953_cov_15.585297_11_plen_152_part_00